MQGQIKSNICNAGKTEKTNAALIGFLLSSYKITSLNFLGLLPHAQQREAQGAGTEAVRLEAAQPARESIHQRPVLGGNGRGAANRIRHYNADYVWRINAKTSPEQPRKI